MVWLQNRTLQASLDSGAQQSFTFSEMSEQKQLKLTVHKTFSQTKPSLALKVPLTLLIKTITQLHTIFQAMKQLIQPRNYNHKI